jgi:hypothetical protein
LTAGVWEKPQGRRRSDLSRLGCPMNSGNASSGIRKSGSFRRSSNSRLTQIASVKPNL